MTEKYSSIPSWKILDQIRANSNVSDFIETLAMLIYLRWADFQEAEQEAIAAFDDTTYEPVLPSSLHWRTWYQLPSAKLLNALLHELHPRLKKLTNTRHNSLATNLYRLSGQMHAIGAIPQNSLIDVVQWLAAQPFETAADRRQLLDVFDRSLLYSVKGHEGGIRPHLIPKNVALFIALLAEPKEGNRIYDPCFGSAGLLTAAFDAVLNSEKQKSARNGVAGLAISGVEINSSAYIVGLSRLALAGINDPQLELGNSLERTQPNNPQQEGFDVVVANPPFGLRVNLEVIDNYPVQTKDATGLFIQHSLAQLRPGGRAVIVVPQGFLFRGGPERKLRQYLLEQHTVETVISLPATTFWPFTSVKTNILVLRRGGATKKIRMVDAEQFFAQGKGRQQATILENQIHELVGKIRAAKPSDTCWDIDAETLSITDYDLTPRRRDQSGLGNILSSLGPSVEIVRLKDCCRKIMPGRQIRVADLVEELPPSSRPANLQKLFAANETRQQRLYAPVEPVPYIRIKDIDKGQVNKGSSWVSPELALGVDGHWKLRAGDVLLSKSSTIGKVGVVRNDAVGAVAASGLYILRTDGDRLNPHYLAAYLESSECRTWLQDSASGGIISHLTKRVIEELPVPLPPLDIQRRAASKHKESGTDVLTLLEQLLSGREQSPVHEWVKAELNLLEQQYESRSSTKSFLSINLPFSTQLELSYFNQIASNIETLREHNATQANASDPTEIWFPIFADALASLYSVDDVPPGPGLLGLLQDVRQNFLKSYEYIKGFEIPARYLHGILDGMVVNSINALLDDVKVHISPYENSIFVGEPAEINFYVQNRSLLPLRNFIITSDPDWGHGRFGYFEENSHKDFSLKGAGPKKIGKLTFTIKWSALRLDGRGVKGEREIAFDVVPADDIQRIDFADIGSSPYVCGSEIRPDRNDVFFGREELLDQIRRHIIKSGNVVLLEGNRRAGKSSILRHLEGVGPVPGWLGVYCSLQGTGGGNISGVPTVNVFRLIAFEIAKGMITLNIEVPLPNGSILARGEKRGISKACRDGISKEHPFEDFRDYAEIALEVVAEKHLGILLMLDEFDKLQEGIDNGVTSPHVPENIRFLVQTYPGFSAILTGSRRLKRLREEYWSALFGLGTRFGVTSLSREAARRLVTEPVEDLLVYSGEAIEKAIKLTNCQPFLLQSLCNRVFDMAAQLKIGSITLDVIEEAATLLADDNEHFRSLWKYAETDRRRLILWLIHKASAGPDPLRFGFLRELLSDHGVEVDEEALNGDLEFLRELELIDLVGESGSGHYALTIPLMGKWIGRQHDFEVLRNKARMETEENHG